jgi:hypothetical protein
VNKKPPVVSRDPDGRRDRRAVDFTRGKASVVINPSGIGISGSDRKWQLEVSVG